VKGDGNPESFIVNNFTQLDVTSGLPEKRKPSFSRTLITSNPLTTGRRGNDIDLVFEIWWDVAFLFAGF